MNTSLAAAAGKSTRESLANLGDPDIEATLGHMGSVDGDRTTDYSVGTATSDGQRFRLLRSHARGGLGAGFVAVDQELHREVAVKQILEKHADDPLSRERFIAEAEITGGLEHPGWRSANRRWAESCSTRGTSPTRWRRSSGRAPT